MSAIFDRSKLFNLAAPHQYSLVMVIMSTTSLAAFLANQWVLSNIATLLVLQLGVVMSALLSDKLPSLLSGLFGALAYNYLFTKPYFSFHMEEYDDVMNMLVFLSIAVITSHLADYYKQQREQLKQAQLRASILLSVSHDLRTPLAGIIGNLETLKEYQHKLTDQDCNDLLTTAITEGHRLHRYIENLLQATRLQQGAVNLQFTTVDIRQLLRPVVGRFDTQRIQINQQTDRVAGGF